MKENNFEIRSKSGLSLISCVQELRLSRSKQTWKKPFTPRLVDWSSWLEADSKDQPYGVFTIVCMYYNTDITKGGLKKRWVSRKEHKKTHKGLVMEIM